MQRKLLLILLVVVNNAWAQVDNSFLSEPININKNDSNQFGFSTFVFNYMRNTEYFNKVELGRTLFGNQIMPSFHYQPNGNIKLQAGVFVRNDFDGETSFTQVIPTFTLKTKYQNFEMLFGTLEGATSHRIIEPMFDIARAIENRIENGFQIKYLTEKTFLDGWINWEKFIERGSPHKEKFTAGFNYTHELNNPKNRFKVYSILQGMLSHAGGQIDKDSVNPLTMQANYSIGFKTIYQISKKQKISYDAYYLGYKDTGDSTAIPFNQGFAVFSNLSYQYSGLQLMCSYFASGNFISPRGTAIYQGNSIDFKNYYPRNRELVFLRLFYNKVIFNQIKMSARFEPVFDLANPIFDYSYSFYLSYHFDKNFK
ncbi:MAG: hypothetical protein ACEQSR_11125 [Candidatus Methylacidiphilales bacterium]